MASSVAGRLASVRERLPAGTLELACHVAIPVAFDAGFLNLVRVNFFLDPPIVLPYDAEAALLLSPLCRELGEGLYEIDPELRNLLLASLVARFGNERLERVAMLLELYTDRRLSWRVMPELEYAQRLTVLNLLDPRAAERWLETARRQAEGAEELNREWFVAMDLRRLAENHREDLDELTSDAVRRVEAGGDGSAEAARKLGELALLPGSDLDRIVPALEAMLPETPEGDQTPRRVLQTIRRLFPDLPETSSPPEPAPDRSVIVISYVSRDRAWAEWARWHLESVGYSTELDCADSRAGDDVAERIQGALQRANQVLLLLSSAYLRRQLIMLDELRAQVLQPRSGAVARLILVRIDSVGLDPIWAPLHVQDLFERPAAEAEHLLLDIALGDLEPLGSFPISESPHDPADPGPRPPGALPPVFNLPHRNLGYTGREDVLSRLRDALSGDGPVAVQAVHGMAGVGKTQLVLEYAWRFAGEYDLIWWVSAEKPGLIGEQFAALGVASGIVDAAVDSATTRSTVLEHLAERRRWLLIFDNAVDRDDVLPWLPRGSGHVLIASRTGNWHQVADTVELDVPPRDEATQFLAQNLPGLDRIEAERLADALGDLPLALAQAVVFLSETGMPVAEYRQVLVEQPQAVLEVGEPRDYPRSFATAVTLSLAALSGADPAAVAILQLCAFLAPGPVPVDLIVEVAASGEPCPQALSAARDVMSHPVARQRTIGRLGAFGLARLAPGTVTVHRLTQAVVRSRLPQSVSEELSSHLEAALGGMRPGDPSDPATWPAWARLLPHLLAVEPGLSDDPGLRECASDAVAYLLSRGDAGSARRLAENLYTAWRPRLGSEHRDTLRAATELARALHDLGEYDELRVLVDDTMSPQINAVGYDDPDPGTLRGAADLVLVLHTSGDHQRAVRLGREVWEGRRRVLGEDHPDTLTSASNIAMSLSGLGRHREASTLHQQVWEQRRRVLGEDHPDTLSAGLNLAIAYFQLGQYLLARRLVDQVRKGLQDLFGAEHPETRRATALRKMVVTAMGGRAT
ncbi:FxSxx-COOH system tetratricopeptide repeat protein [Actinoplanes sp. NPDC026623]|uniref:FxSxx-COOH system tetratricopeptide repeat protein n=1 Tax=Actinoplanes sp. NPDC026623 TaxID=3155610 RepID=UPI0033DD2E41